jgi:hypothetical protein
MIRPPPRTEDIKELQRWCEELHEFMKYPSFEVIRFKPRSVAPATTEGNVYYDSDTDILMIRNASAWVEIGDMT